MNVQRLRVTWNGGSVSAAWHLPPDADAYLVLGHGAGGTMHTPGLVRVAEALAARGIAVLCFNFPYAEAKRRAPDPQRVLEACYLAAASAAARRTGRLFLGGRSMGGRIASHVVADGFPASGLVFLGYPLHPPGRPERLRDAHLPRVRVPMLFVQGTRDSFARTDLLQDLLTRLPGATLHLVEGADHGLTVRGRDAAAITEEVADAVARWIATVPPA